MGCSLGGMYSNVGNVVLSATTLTIASFHLPPLLVLAVFDEPRRLDSAVYSTPPVCSNQTTTPYL